MVKTISLTRRALRVGILARAQICDGWFAGFSFCAADFASERAVKRVHWAPCFACEVTTLSLRLGRREGPVPQVRRSPLHAQLGIHPTSDRARQDNLGGLRAKPKQRGAFGQPLFSTPMRTGVLVRAVLARFLGKFATIRLQGCEVARDLSFPSGENRRGCHK